MKKTQNRRQFITRTTASATAALAIPQLLLANKNSKQTIIGEGEHQYEVRHDFAKLPDELSSIPEAGVEVLCLEHGLISFSYHNNTGSLRNDGAKSLEVFNEDVTTSR